MYSILKMCLGKIESLHYLQLLQTTLTKLS
jgi:hypothetical protein